MIVDRFSMRDVLVVLPGIGGSALARNGREIWGPAPGALLAYVRSLGRTLDSLVLQRDDPDDDGGVEATRLVPYTFLPGLSRFDGYSGLKAHLFDRFYLTPGNPRVSDGSPANYFEFPYDWRRDNARAAARLQAFVDRELPKWRTHTDNPDAKIIFLAHSMGGLVARYYIEVLKGFRSTRALVTFGTPHRGAPQAIDYLVNGYRKLGRELRDLTAMMQSFPSVYQLLPRYKALRDHDGIWKRVFETEQDLPRIDRARAQRAFGLYDSIDRAHAANLRDEDYHVQLLPLVGWGHETLQSAHVGAGGRVEIIDELPPAVDRVLDNGDGTVPRVSAVPLEMNDQPLRWWTINQKHATLQNNREMVADLAQRIGALQGNLREPARALGDAPAHGLGLRIDDVFESNEPVAIRVTLHTNEDPQAIVARIEPSDEESSPGDAARLQSREVSLAPTGNTWTGEAEGLPGGRYRVTIHPRNPRVGPPDPVADIFEVL